MCIYEALFKCKVIAFMEENGNWAALGKYSVPETDIQGWGKQKVDLTTCKCTHKGLTGPRKGRHSETEYTATGNGDRLP